MSATRAAVMVVGAAGRMGSLTAATVTAQPDLELVATVDPRFEPGDEGPVPRFRSVGAALDRVRPLVAVDFTVPSAVALTVAEVLRAGVHAVVGATGLGDAEVERLDGIRAESGANLFIAPNFALGAVLLMRFARQAAIHYRSAEIVELHHDGKVDAPSGTALRTARLMAEARAAQATSPSRASAAADDQPSRGLLSDETPIHSVRLPGLVAHQEVLFGGAGELLTLRHDSFSRESFMAGVLLAVRRIEELEGTVVGLEHLLG
jgi:4-hydroxy-tetrahydrodipicolinate reductase